MAKIEDYFENTVNEFKLKMDTYYSKFESPDRKYIKDGLVNLDEYISSPIKILWILKEPYDDGKNGGGGWSIVDDLNLYRSENKKKDSQATWYPIAYSVYGIINGFIKYENMGRIPKDPEIIRCLKCIGFINIQKLPARNTSNNSKIAKAYKEHNEILIEQINILNPDIIICGAGTNIYCKLNDDSHRIMNFEKKRIIEVYHPAQRVKRRSNYVNEIIEKSEKFWIVKNQC